MASASDPRAVRGNYVPVSLPVKRVNGVPQFTSRIFFDEYQALGDYLEREWLNLPSHSRPRLASLLANASPETRAVFNHDLAFYEQIEKDGARRMPFDKRMTPADYFPGAN